MSEARAPTLASFLMTWHRTSTIVHALTHVLVRYAVPVRCTLCTHATTMATTMLQCCTSSLCDTADS